MSDGRIRILIADDDPVILEILQKTLWSFGYDVVCARDGKEAWEMYVGQTPNIVITDWMMPKVNGLEFTRMIRSHNLFPYTYIFFLTVLGGKGSYIESIHAGADDFITKPVDADELRVRLHVAERTIRLHTHAKRLEGMFNACPGCKRIMQQDRTWASIESLLVEKSYASVSHGVCPHCYETVMKPQIESFKNRNKTISDQRM
ncbi:MAG: response regulator [Bacteroidota bacterium]